MFRQLTYGRRAKRHLSCAVVPVVTCSGENSAASHATSARTRSMVHGGVRGAQLRRSSAYPFYEKAVTADTSRQRGHGPSGENLFPEKNPTQDGWPPHQSPSSPPSLTSARAQHDFGAGSLRPGTFRETTALDSPVHHRPTSCAVSRHDEHALSPCHIPSSHRKGKWLSSRSV